MLTRLAFCFLLVGCAASQAAPHTPAPPVAATVPSAETVGVVRTDGRSYVCEHVVAIHSDGGASVACTYRHSCLIRELGPDGEERGRSDLVPGKCMDWVPREDGGGFMVTAGSSDHQRIRITSLDAAGHAGAALELTSGHWAFPRAVIGAPDGGLFLAVTLRDDLTVATTPPRRLAYAPYFRGVVLRLPAALDDVTWARVFRARSTQVEGLLPRPNGGVEAIVSFQGTLRAAGAPLTGSGEHRLGIARVSLDDDGRPLEQHDWTIEPGWATTAVAIDGGAAILALGHHVTIVASDGTRGATLEIRTARRLDAVDGVAWVVDCDCERGERHAGPWTAHELGGAGRRLSLRGSLGGSVEWSSIRVRGARVAATGTDTDPRTETPVTFTVLATIDPTSPEPEVDLESLTHVNRLHLAPGCQHVERRSIWEVVDEAQERERAAIEACGARFPMRADIRTWPDGGIATWEMTMTANAPVDAQVAECVRRVFERALACPQLGGARNLSFPVLPPRAQ